MMGDSGDSGEGDGELNHGNLHQAMILRSSAIWRRRLAVFTAVFITVTIFFRWRNDRYEKREEAAEEASEISAAPDWIKDGDNIRQSCGEYFEPSPIMKLKNSSTVENMENGVGKCGFFS